MNKEFYAKMQIAYKELLETDYWLRLLNENEYINDINYRKFCTKLDELRKILVSIQRKMR